MLSKRYLLKSQDNFSRVRREGRRCKSENFALFALPNQLDCSRLGMVIGGKVGLTSVERNRLRRCLTDALALITWDKQPGNDIVIVALKRPAEIGVASIGAELNQCLKNLSLI